MEEEREEEEVAATVIVWAGVKNSTQQRIKISVTSSRPSLAILES